MRVPNEPKPTCPLINRIIKDIESLDPSDGRFDRDRRDLIAAMEDLRDANSSIRSWGQYHADLAESQGNEYQEIIDRLREEASDDADSIYDLKSTVKELEAEVWRLTKELRFYEDAI